MKKISILLLMIFMILTLTACNSMETPEEAVNNALNAVKEADTETIEKYFDSDITFEGIEDQDIDDEKQVLVENLNFETLSSIEEEGNAVVEANITNIDMLPVMQKSFVKAMELAFSDLSEEEIEKQSEEIIINQLNEDDLKTITSKVDIHLENVDNQWKIDLDDNLINALFGNLQTIIEDLNNISD